MYKSYKKEFKKMKLLVLNSKFRPIHLMQGVFLI
jgi:hypothetical protein